MSNGHDYKAPIKRGYQTLFILTYCYVLVCIGCGY